MSWLQALTDVLLVVGGVLVGVVLEHERALWAAHRRRGGTLEFTSGTIPPGTEWTWPPPPLGISPSVSSHRSRLSVAPSTGSSGVDPGPREAA